MFCLLADGQAHRRPLEGKRRTRGWPGEVAPVSADDEPEYPELVYRLARAYGVSPGYVFRTGFEDMPVTDHGVRPVPEEDDGGATWTPDDDEKPPDRS